MKLIRTITESDFGRQENPEQWPSYTLRPSARAVLINEKAEIALMYVENQHYYKLPGGGIDEGETIETGLSRELSEEVGAQSFEIIAELGQIDEYREKLNRKSEHYAFLAKLNGELSEPARTEKELDQGYTTVWVKNIDEAIKLVESGKPTQYGQDFERLRELTFLQYVKQHNLL